jgi:triacylglycerol esterase/lipase EstA (alpha/beta hydrolase family)
MTTNTRPYVRAFLAAVVLAGCAFAPAAAPAAESFAPIDRPGPAPTASEADLQASLACSGNLDNATKTPVLLVPATTVNSRENYGWNYMPYLRELGFPYCTTDLPGELGQNMGDMQVRGDYIAYAIRQMFARAHRRIAILGHSRGGMVMRWALRFWPDTRGMVDDVIGMAGTNHGSAVVPALCVPGCAPALWQQRNNASFYQALNSGQETFAGISYTEIYSHADEFVQPNLSNTGTSSLHTGHGKITNVAVQDICPTDTPDHVLIGTVDPVAAALVLDALTHDGAADPGRIGHAACGRLFMPGVDTATAATNLVDLSARIATQLVLAKHVDAEPPLACYTTPAGCPGQPAAAPSAPSKACTSPRRVRLYLDHLGFHVRQVTVAGKRVRITRRGGRPVAVITLRGRRAGKLRVRITGRTAAGKARHATRTYRTCG